ncbi:protocatechuate 3,4-dioxygenase subunit alpha [Microbacterium sp. STN6]|uniref:protocatechuate 3,4-dioxygenase subunit alpha n=1 Tax=Microbacterium sp. STN6 TaxID=2995588 RepID=UPI002260C36A|nr:protocatechuate 3,4-dioxygenase subunit alpha [Microbacterium sp. STN6]MCX7522261.1 protocatechuate 3,4-dioxygenase subunit alpha [Microbacterium sp. STN6]
MTEREYLQTPSQTVGPFFGYALPYEGGGELIAAHRPDAIRLHGTVFDGNGQTVPDALIELWQADADGSIVQRQGSFRRDGYTFTGFGRAATTLAGDYSFTTVKPGAVGSSAPYCFVTVFARGLLHHLFTRAYFPEDSEAQATDAVLAAVPAERRSTLIAALDGPGSYRFDIHLQGENETVFFDFDA